jgi:hypothetical protein
MMKVEGLTVETAEQAKPELIEIADRARSDALSAACDAGEKVEIVNRGLQGCREIEPYMTAIRVDGGVVAAVVALREIKDGLGREGAVTPDTLPGLVYAAAALETMGDLYRDADFRKQYNIEGNLGYKPLAANFVSREIKRALQRAGMETESVL